MQIKERFPIWDNLKFFLITLVVIGHVMALYINESTFYEGVFVFIYLFHMPAFLFISGLFSKRTVDTNDIKKVMPYITLYFAVKILHFLFRACLFGKTEASFLNESGLPWFMMSLFFMYVITMYTKRFKPSWVLFCSIALSVFAGYAIKDGRDFLAVLRTINFYPFFYLGYIINPDELLDKLKKPAFKIASASLLSGLLAICFIFTDTVVKIKPLLSGKNYYSGYAGLLRLALFFVIIAVIFALISLTPNKKLCYTHLGQRTLAVYCTHYCFTYVLFNLLDIKQWIESALPSLWQAVLIVISVIITLLCSNKWFDKACRYFLDYKSRLKKEI